MEVSTDIITSIKARSFGLDDILAIMSVSTFSNSDGHQFHQCQQNGQSPLISTELTEH
jgi:hypothetical protein